MRLKPVAPILLVQAIADTEHLAFSMGSVGLRMRLKPRAAVAAPTTRHIGAEVR